MQRRLSTNLETPEPSEGGNNPEYSASCGDGAHQWDDDLTEANVDSAIQLPQDYATSIQDPELFWDDMWKQFEPYIKPYEGDRNNYRLYERPLVVECHLSLWQRLTCQGSQLRSAVDGFMLLGLIPVDMREVDPGAHSSPTTEQPPLSSSAEHNDGDSPQGGEFSPHGKEPGVSLTPLSGSYRWDAPTGGFPTSSSASKSPNAPNSKPPLGASLAFAAGGGGGIINSGCQFRSSSPMQRTGMPNYRDATVPMTNKAGSVSPSASVIRFQVVVDQVTRNRATVSFDDPPEPQPGDKIRELEMEVKELTRQLRLMKSREKSPGPGVMMGGVVVGVPSLTTTTPLVGVAQSASGGGGGSTPGKQAEATGPSAGPFDAGVSPGSGSGGGGLVDSRANSPHAPPIPQIIVSRPYVASVFGNTPVCLQLNYLDPDTAPFHISVAFVTGKQILPSTVVNHRYLVFVAPAHPGGSVAATVLCTSGGGSLRKYAKACWIEYKDLGGQGLSHHAVNQLVSDIPLAPHSFSATTAADQSEMAGTEMGAGTEGGKSEGDGALMDDVETATALSADTLGGGIITPGGADHPPLTREMLDMLSGTRAAMFAAQDNTDRSEARQRGASMEGDTGGGGSSGSQLRGGTILRSGSHAARGGGAGGASNHHHHNANGGPQEGGTVNSSNNTHGEPEPEAGSEDGRETVASSLAITMVTHGGSVINDVVSVSQATSVGTQSNVGDER